MVDWHKVAFEVPILASLNDEQLESLYFDRDGRWSSEIKNALARFQTDRLDLDENWASCPPTWKCPGCDRVKRDLVRLTSKGVLLARLDIHHDHLTDLFKAILHEHLGNKWLDSAPPDSGHLEKLGARLVARFQPSVVCIDCNAADGQVKRRMRDIPRAFSFRPSEIRRFVRAKPNSEHEIDLAAAQAIFAEVTEDFERRVAIVELLAGHLINGEMTCERGNLPPAGVPKPLGMHGYLHRWFLRDCPGMNSAISGDVDGFVARSVSRDGIATNPKRPRGPLVRPTPEEIAKHDGGGAPQLWKAAPVDWQCSGCRRDRGGIMRKSKNPKRDWTGRLLRHVEYILAEPWADDDEDLVESPRAPFILRHEHHLVCHDCAAILPGVKSRQPAISAAGGHFQIEDFRAVATFVPNEAHVVDWTRATERARCSLPLVAEAHRYWAHFNTVVGCRDNYRRLLEKYGNNKKHAWAALRTLYAEDFGAEDDLDEELMFMLDEAERIGIEDPWQGLTVT